MSRAYGVFDHTADIGLRARGATREELYSNAARGLMSVMVDLRRVHTTTSVAIDAMAEGAHADEADLLVAFLSEVLFRASVGRLVLRDFDVTFPSKGRVAATARGEAVTERHAIEREIKAVTYHQARVRRDARGYSARVILDI